MYLCIFKNNSFRMSHFTFYTKWLLLAGMVLAFASCGKKNTDNTMSNIDEPTVNEVVANLGRLHGDAVLERAQRSVPQVAALWTSEDGTPGRQRSSRPHGRHLASQPRKPVGLF